MTAVYLFPHICQNWNKLFFIFQSNTAPVACQALKPKKFSSSHVCVYVLLHTAHTHQCFPLNTLHWDDITRKVHFSRPLGCRAFIVLGLSSSEKQPYSLTISQQVITTHIYSYCWAASPISCCYYYRCEVKRSYGEEVRDGMTLIQEAAVCDQRPEVNGELL